MQSARGERYLILGCNKGQRIRGEEDNPELNDSVRA